MRPNLEQNLQKHYDLGPGLHQCFTIDEAEDCSYLRIHPLNDEIRDFTVDTFIRLSKLNTETGIVSYASGRSDNDLTVTLRAAFVFGKRLFFVSSLTTKTHVFERLTIVKKQGEFKFYLNEQLYKTFLAEDKPLLQNGYWVLGQEQDSVGGGFAAYHQFHGMICDFQMWNRALDDSTIERLFSDVSSVEAGNVFDNPPTYQFEKKRC